MQLNNIDDYVNNYCSRNILGILKLSINEGQNAFETFCQSEGILKKAMARPALGHLQRVYINVYVEELLEQNNMLIHIENHKVNAAYNYPEFIVKGFSFTVNKNQNNRTLPRKAKHRQELSRRNEGMYNRDEITLFDTYNKNDEIISPYGILGFGGKGFTISHCGLIFPNANYDGIICAKNLNDIIVPLPDIQFNKPEIELKLKEQNGILKDIM